MNDIERQKLYGVWRDMIKRCYCVTGRLYKFYGGRGIRVCDRWRRFVNFIEDMAPSYQLGLQLERIKNDEGYSPDNCKWATRLEQCNNRRSNRRIDFGGVSMTLAQWGRKTGLGPTVRQRLHDGWSVEEALTQPKRILQNGRYVLSQ
jgi:hypothetical protein